MSDNFLARVTVKPYGVLGTRLGQSAAKPVAEPGNDVAVVDPAGLPYVQQTGPSGAGGAAGAIYKWLGIQDDPAFPDPVREAIKSAGDAKHHAYGEKQCIHVVGPDFRQLPNETRAGAVQLLAGAYWNILREFSGAPASRLRMLPVSGSIFAGQFQAQMPAITVEALGRGFALLTGEHRIQLMQRQFEMCIFMPDEFADFQKAFAAGASVASTAVANPSTMRRPPVLAAPPTVFALNIVEERGSKATIRKMRPKALPPGADKAQMQPAVTTMSSQLPPQQPEESGSFCALQ